MRRQRCLEAVSELVDVAAEPQWIGLFGSLRGELLARRRDLTGAQRAVQDALDRLELCTDDVMRIARVSAIGAQSRGRSRAARPGSGRGRGRGATRSRGPGSTSQRLDAAAQEGGPVERARFAQGRAELARARGRDAQRDWAKAAKAWEAIERPYPLAVARWREAEALVAANDRGGAAVGRR